MKRIVLAFLTVLALVAADPVKTGYFRSPVDIPISLSGAFGEIRRNHFHSGIDIRTGGAEGKPVYAIADGYVARVFVSATGFGKALYVAHPNGYTSVYGHLRSFAGKTAPWVKGQQYAKESFAIDEEVPSGTLPVKKGDIIAWSGNSGSSGGPHLHFEIRDSKTQEIVDPLDFGFLKPDDDPPGISLIRIYPMGPGATVNRSVLPVQFAVQGSGRSFRLANQDTINVSGRIIFGIETSESTSGGLKTGVHGIELMIDGVAVYSQNIERFAFSETRYANSLIDYPAFIQHKRKIQRSYVAPNNKLRIYKNVVNQGIVTFSDNRVHQIKYLVTDAFGNQAECRFTVQSIAPDPARATVPSGNSVAVQTFTIKSENHFGRSNVKFTVPADALYEDLPFEYASTPAVQHTLSDVHHLHNQNTPLHTFCTLSIRADRIPAAQARKAILVSVDGAGRITSKGGTYAEGWVTGKVRELGSYALAVDLESPVIKPVNIFPNKKVTKQSSILVKIYDNLSGIKTYRATLNGKWILMDYDEKNRLLTYMFDERLRPGKNLFVLTIADGVGNTTKYEATLIR